jgi:dTDP-4-amino-4,6-dideoxygalactose transaminase
MASINYYNLKEQYADCQDFILGGMQTVFASGQFYSGEAHNAVARYIRVKYDNAHVELTNSGTSALIAALMSLYTKRGSRVLLPALTYAATAQAIISVGCIPIFVDIDSSWLLDIDLLDEMYAKYGDEISTLITVDLYGQGVDLDKVRKWCDKNNIKWIIDAAHSFGICNKEYNQTFADAICLSFNPLKNLGGIGGGAVVSKTIHPTILSATCMMGKTERGPHGAIELPGLNFRMSSTQAATLVVKAPYFEDHIIRKMKICETYYNNFKNFPNKIDLPMRKSWGTWNYYSFSIAPVRHEDVKAALKEAGIECSSHYSKSLNREGFVKQYGYQPCPEAEYITSKGRIISLPSHWHLTNDEINRVIVTVLSAI